MTLVVSASDPDLELLRRSAIALDCQLEIVDGVRNNISSERVLDLTGAFINV
ncbi:MAG TPA: hypothetical protein VNC78_07875 [Actinomycetota bacterium]|nr:hypothetical protein [Actinomycetota bacterium]